jgi:hypothetical protein
VDIVDKWLSDQSSTPTVSILLFLLMFAVRLGIDQWLRQRAAKKHAHHHKAKSS